ncbi:hypothetical protein [Lacinutrix chionoecetis]
MEDHTTNWTKKEFLTYLYIYCINADYVETKKELAYVKAKTTDAIYNKMHDEFDQDNDYACIQKIINTHERLGYTKQSTQELFNNIKELFLSDGSLDSEEQIILKGLKHLLKS